MRSRKENKFWHHRNVFLTGSTGLLGSWTSKKLSDLGANIVALIRDHVYRSKFFSNIQISKTNIVYGNVEDYYLIERILGEYEIDTVLHLAAQTIAPIANRNPLSTFETNIKGTWTLLEACRRSPLVKRIIISSSDKAYGEHAELPYKEELPLQGNHPYDVSKSCADLIAQAYYHSFKLPVCVTRCGNLYGGGDLNFNRLIPGTIRSIIFNERPIIRSDGSYVRDFLYVEDAVSGLLKLTAAMQDAKILGQAFNISNENPLTAKKVVFKILAKMKSNLKPKIINNARNEIYKQYLSARKARKTLKWKPNHSLDLGLDKTIKWYYEYFKKDESINRKTTSEKSI